MDGLLSAETKRIEFVEVRRGYKAAKVIERTWDLLSNSTSRGSISILDRFLQDESVASMSNLSAEEKKIKALRVRTAVARMLPSSKSGWKAKNIAEKGAKIAPCPGFEWIKS